MADETSGNGYGETGGWDKVNTEGKSLRTFEIHVLVPTHKCMEYKIKNVVEFLENSIAKNYMFTDNKGKKFAFPIKYSVVIEW